MAKKKGKDPSKATLKAAKKAKAVQKVEKKEKKKTTKTKDEFEDDDEDLEGILDRVSPLSTSRLQIEGIWVLVGSPNAGARSVDPKGMGGGTQGHRGARRGPAQPARERDAHAMSEREPPVVHRRGVLQRRREGGAYAIFCASAWTVWALPWASTSTAMSSAIHRRRCDECLRV